MATNIIVADDSKVFRESIVSIITHLCNKLRIKSKIDEVVDGKELIEKVINTDYDFVFTDNRMPNIHGLDATRLIRIHNKDIPIYLLSAKELDRQDWESAGATGYFNKDDDTLISGIGKALEKYLK